MLSLIIPSYNEKEKLVETIYSFIDQTELISELIVVIDNDQDTSTESDLKKTFGSRINLKVHTQKNSGRAVARNKGAELASGDLLLFLDNDMLCEKDCIAKHIDFHKKNKDCILTGNGFRNPAAAKKDFDHYLIALEKKAIQKMKSGIWISFHDFSMTACNLSMPKQVFDSLGGFDTHLKDSEDLDFGIRALNKKIPIFYDREVIAWHNDFEGILKFISRHNQYTEGKKTLLQLHPEYEKFMPHLSTQKNGMLKITLLRILKRTICPLAIHGGAFFSMLPKRTRFFLYRLTISAHSTINA